MHARPCSVVAGAVLLLSACRGSRDTPSAKPEPVKSSAAVAVVAPSLNALDAGSETKRAKDLNVLFLSIDSLRADMPWAGYPRAIAPRLTELEKRSVSYTHAYSISSYTSMSLGGFLGGRWPSEMKRNGFFFGKYAPDNLMFPALLQHAGVRTLAAHAHSYFNSAGFENGFDTWEIVPGIVFKNETDPNVTSPQHEAIAERLLGDPQLDTKRFFAWFHFLDPHDQYISHEKDGIAPYGKTLRDRYDAEVTYTDRYIGKLLDFVATRAWANRTVIVVTADHGEAFGEHHQFNHGFEVWENLVRVPMFFVVPGATPHRIDVPRSAIDLAPTMMDLFGVPTHASFEGKSLVPELFGAAADPRDVIVDLPMTSDNDKRRALVNGTLKIVAYGKEETLRLFDLTADPEEISPITRGDAFDAMVKRYREFAKTVKELPPTACGTGCLNRAYANKP
jgi:arylsulfatase A-like enzyme